MHASTHQSRALTGYNVYDASGRLVQDRLRSLKAAVRAARQVHGDVAERWSTGGMVYEKWLRPLRSTRARRSR